MRSVRHLLTAAALLAAAACANSDGITSPRSAAPPRLDGGGYMGSGALGDPGEDAGGVTSGAPEGGLAVPGDSAAAGGGRGGYMGSGA